MNKYCVAKYADGDMLEQQVVLASSELEALYSCIENIDILEYKRYVVLYNIDEDTDNFIDWCYNYLEVTICVLEI